MQPKKPSGLLFIFITVVIDIIGLGIIIPVMPKLIQELTGGDISDASRFGGWLVFTYAITQFLFASVLGNLSDKYGRRPVLLISLIGFSLNYLLMGIAPTIAWLFVGRLIAGITGASYTVAAAYIADISTPEKKAQNFGLLGAAFGLGFIIGPVLGGLLGHFGSRVPFYAAATLCFLNFLYGYFVVPESLNPEFKRPFSWKNANPIGTFLHIKSHNIILPLVFCIFLVNMASHSVQSTWSYYTIEKFDWDEKKVGLSLGFIGALLMIVQAGLIRVIIPKIGTQKAIIIGLIFYIISFPLYGLANHSWMLFAISVPYVLAGITGPALQSSISNLVPPNEQGQIQGGITSVISLTTILGPLIMTNLFSYFSKKTDSTIYFPGAPFILSGVLAVISLVIIVNYFKKSK